MIAIDVSGARTRHGPPTPGTGRTSLPDPARDGPHFWGCARIVPVETIRSLLEFG